MIIINKIKELKKKSKKEAKKTITATISEETFQKFSEICKKENIFKSSVIRELIEEFVREYKKNS